jgi:hypothetical protein
VLDSLAAPIGTRSVTDWVARSPIERNYRLGHAMVANELDYGLAYRWGQASENVSVASWSAEQLEATSLISSVAMRAQ